MFKPKLLSNQVKLTLFLGLALILLPFFLPTARAEPAAMGAETATRPGSETAPVPAANPPEGADEGDSNSGSAGEARITAVA